MSDDIPTFPAVAELLALWPLWLLLVCLISLYVFSEIMQRQTARWHRMKRQQELMFLEQERQRRLLQK